MDKLPVVYITSSGRSGSTLVDLLLGHHSGIESVGEVTHLDKWLDEDHLCSCSRPISECPFWGDIREDLPQNFRLGSLTQKQLRSSLLFNPAFETAHSYGLSSYHLFESVLKNTSKQILVDSSKSIQRLIYLLQSDLFTVYVLHIVRNGKAVLYSTKKEFVRPDSKQVVQAQSSVYSSARWTIHNLVRQALVRRQLPPYNYLRIRYEDVVHNPSQEMRRICSWLGIPYEEQMTVLNTKDIHNIGGSRWRFSNQENIPIKLDDSWKTNLATKDKIVFNLVGGWLNHYYGF